MVPCHFELPDYLVRNSNPVEQLIIVKQLAVAQDLDTVFLKDAQLVVFALLNA